MAGAQTAPMLFERAESSEGEKEQARWEGGETHVGRNPKPAPKNEVAKDHLSAWVMALGLAGSADAAGAA